MPLVKNTYGDGFHPELRTLLLRVRDDNGGFLRDTDLVELAKLDRLRQVLIRCGNGRMVVAAQDAKHFADIVDRDGVDYVRDVALLSTDKVYRPECRGDFSPVTNDPPPPPKPSPVLAASRKADRVRSLTGCDSEMFYDTSDADPGL